jgi:hypothetical protein
MADVTAEGQDSSRSDSARRTRRRMRESIRFILSPVTLTVPVNSA